MTLSDEASSFLKSRRRRVSPSQFDLPLDAGRRRQPGLRREEVAVLANISHQYYAQIERGQLDGVSDSVLNAVADVLCLNEDERWAFFGLARAQSASSFRTWDPSPRVRPRIQTLIDGMEMPAWVLRHGGEVIAANRWARAVFGPVLASEVQPPNNPRFVFLDPAARGFLADWVAEADYLVGVLFSFASQYPDDVALAETVGLLRRDCPEFETRWKTCRVAPLHNHPVRLNHPLFGELNLGAETLALPSDHGHSVIAHVIEPGSPTQAALAALDHRHSADDDGPALAAELAPPPRVPRQNRVMPGPPAAPLRGWARGGAGRRGNPRGADRDALTASGSAPLFPTRLGGGGCAAG
ncbi:MAG: helix-turn-helix transcriptional regulator [Bifidobacteriaceae bacterium]|jgi:transcriptional regulator with XRE-family HTH domain|nr:helix-turn-helix transcriptional regulator [Bifidobacteriaceae bacterium]